MNNWVLAPPGDQPAVDLEREIAALADDVSAPATSRILIAVPDRTRAYPLAEVLPALVESLRARGADEARIRVVIASGTHRASDFELSPRHLGELPAGVRVLRHDADAPGTACGTTPAGTPIVVNPELLEADAVVALGSTVFHYFAGFGGGGKMLFPGLGTRASVAANHHRSLGPWPPGGLAPGVEPGRLDGNPVAEDLAAAHALLPATRHLTLWQVGGGHAGGRWSEPAEFRALCARYSEGRRVGEPLAHDVVIANTGSSTPVDWVQSHKALFHAARFAKDGGEVILSTQCPEGSGSAALERWLSRPDLATLERDARVDYDLNAQTAISLATIARRVRVTWAPGSPGSLLERWGIRMGESPEVESARACADAPANGRIVRIVDVTGCLPAIEPAA